MNLQLPTCRNSALSEVKDETTSITKGDLECPQVSRITKAISSHVVEFRLNDQVERVANERTKPVTREPDELFGKSPPRHSSLRCQGKLFAPAATTAVLGTSGALLTPTPTQASVAGTREPRTASCPRGYPSTSTFS